MLTSLLLASTVGVLSSPAPTTVTIAWDAVKVRTSTAATIEVDVMPFLGRTDFGGPFNAYYESLENLGAEYVRYAPWFPNPRVVVPELVPSDCTATKPATNWNSSYFDDIMRDFMAAVCGPNAVAGECKLSVVQQLSTMPSWMYVGGFCPDASPDCLPINPWNTSKDWTDYTAGGALVDKTCGQMARYMGRLVGHYTNGGHTDECGHWHESGFHYNWFGLSVLNEDEHNIKPDDGTAYTTCYDAIKKEVAKVNPTITPVGPEIAGTTGTAAAYLLHFLNASNHDDLQPPEIASYHWAGFATNDSTKFLDDWEAMFNNPDGSIQRVEAMKKKTGQSTEMVLNEYIPFVNDWCDLSTVPVPKGSPPATKCPNSQDPAASGNDPNLQHAKGTGINRKTWAWNSAAACFAFGYATLAELQYKYVGQDQLIGGTWPDNEPSVSCMDWQTGQPNAKYWVTNLLATTVGTAEEKTILQSTVTPPTPAKKPSRWYYVAGALAKGSDVIPPANMTLAAAEAKCISLKAGGAGGAAGCQGITFKADTQNPTGIVQVYFKSSTASGDVDADWRTLILDYKVPLPLFVLPYELNGSKGIVLINKLNVAQEVVLTGVVGGEATSVEVDVAHEEPGFAPPIAKTISATGSIVLGPFAVAVVTQVVLK